MTNLVASVITIPNVVGGITGTAVDGAGMRKYATGTAVTDAVVSYNKITVTGLTFQPTFIRYRYVSDATYRLVIDDTWSTTQCSKLPTGAILGGCSISANGFVGSTGVGASGFNFIWECWG